ncbi:hypothetical protein AAT19DRAFT_9154 [Rhodotorula toruloides]|uniref:Uncharacterized protein n=1 Tax=Rhodotorula toruloides TaxID=5286 RepID=A0A2T0AJB3_RHOTO|nr:hypothetical protein AAT19DRAFT_9154 [Rhodotorula toruloides]
MDRRLLGCYEEDYRRVRRGVAQLGDTRISPCSLALPLPRTVPLPIVTSAQRRRPGWPELTSAVPKETASVRTHGSAIPSGYSRFVAALLRSSPTRFPFESPTQSTDGGLCRRDPATVQPERSTRQRMKTGRWRETVDLVYTTTPPLRRPTPAGNTGHPPRYRGRRRCARRASIRADERIVRMPRVPSSSILTAFRSQRASLQ